MSSPTATAPENELNPVDDSKECRDNKDGDVNTFVPHVMSSPTATAPENELNPVDVNAGMSSPTDTFVPHGIKLYYCNDCPDTFWTERGLEIHSDSHARGVREELIKEREKYEERKKQFVESMQKNEECDEQNGENDEQGNHLVQKKIN